MKEQERGNTHKFKLKKFLSSIRKKICSEGCQTSCLELRNLHFGNNKDWEKQFVLTDIAQNGEVYQVVNGRPLQAQPFCDSVVSNGTNKNRFRRSKIEMGLFLILFSKV